MNNGRLYFLRALKAEEFEQRSKISIIPAISHIFIIIIGNVGMSQFDGSAIFIGMKLYGNY